MYSPNTLKVCIDGEKIDASSLDKGINDSTDFHRNQSMLLSGCHEWFHWNHGLIEIENNNAETSKTLLIIGDSFADNIGCLFAENYRYVYAVDPRHLDEDIKHLISNVQSDDALVMLSIYWNDETVLKSIG